MVPSVYQVSGADLHQFIADVALAEFVGLLAAVLLGLFLYELAWSAWRRSFPAKCVCCGVEVKNHD